MVRSLASRGHAREAEKIARVTNPLGYSSTSVNLTCEVEGSIGGGRRAGEAQNLTRSFP